MLNFNNINDIESNGSKYKLATENTNTIHSNTNFLGIKIIAMILILVCWLPIIICDIYYAYNDNSCVNSHVDKININLKQYLQVSGLSLGCFAFIFIIYILSLNENLSHISLGLFVILFYFFIMFLFAWDIIGGVIFWGYMDNSLCSNGIYNYVFASLIIKYISHCSTSYYYKNKD